MINNREREYLKYTLKQERKVLNSLKEIYKEALTSINAKIAYLKARQSVESTTSIIYQLNYQQALKKQIDGILDDLSGKQYEKIQDYLIDCYNNGFVGTVYDLHGQEVPLILPIDQEQVLNALTTDSKLSKPLYDRLGEDIKKLKSTIRHEISRGIASTMSYADIARNIANVSKTGINNAFRIARTEGHRIQNESAFDAMNKAKEKGADVVKQWDATLDGITRKTHRELDGKIFEVDEPFIFNGHKAMYPGGFGVACLDINCRCAVLTRAKWALDDEELNTLKERASYFELNRTKDFEEFNEKYQKVQNNLYSRYMNDKEEVCNKIASGQIEEKTFYESYNYFKKQFKCGIKSPIETVFDSGDRYWHIIARHDDMLGINNINRITKSIKSPNYIYKTFDKFNNSANCYILIEKHNNPLITIIMDGIITSYEPSNDYISRIFKEGELIWQN